MSKSASNAAGGRLPIWQRLGLQRLDPDAILRKNPLDSIMPERLTDLGPCPEHPLGDELFEILRQSHRD